MKLKLDLRPVAAPFVIVGTPEHVLLQAGAQAQKNPEATVIMTLAQAKSLHQALDKVLAVAPAWEQPLPVKQAPPGRPAPQGAADSSRMCQATGCEQVLTEAEYQYSKKNMGVALCRPHQAQAKKNAAAKKR